MDPKRPRTPSGRGRAFGGAPRASEVHAAVARRAWARDRWHRFRRRMPWRHVCAALGIVGIVLAWRLSRQALLYGAGAIAAAALVELVHGKRRRSKRRLAEHLVAGAIVAGGFLIAGLPWLFGGGPPPVDEFGMPRLAGAGDETVEAHQLRMLLTGASVLLASSSIAFLLYGILPRRRDRHGPHAAGTAHGPHGAATPTA